MIILTRSHPRWWWVGRQKRKGKQEANNEPGKWETVSRQNVCFRHSNWRMCVGVAMCGKCCSFVHIHIHICRKDKMLFHIRSANSGQHEPKNGSFRVPCRVPGAESSNDVRCIFDDTLDVAHGNDWLISECEQTAAGRVVPLPGCLFGRGSFFLFTWF